MPHTCHILKSERGWGIASGVTLLISNPGFIQVLHEAVLMGTINSENRHISQTIRYSRIRNSWQIVVSLGISWKEKRKTSKSIAVCAVGNSSWWGLPEDGQRDVLLPWAVFTHADTESRAEEQLARGNQVTFLRGLKLQHCWIPYKRVEFAVGIWEFLKIFLNSSIYLINDKVKKLLQHNNFK